MYITKIFLLKLSIVTTCTTLLYQNPENQSNTESSNILSKQQTVECLDIIHVPNYKRIKRV